MVKLSYPKSGRANLLLEFAFFALAAGGFILGLGGCSGVNRLWGEPPISQAIVELGSDPASRASCADPIEILSEEDSARSAAVLQCWESQLAKVWRSVQGQSEGVLSISEIGFLLKRGVLRISGDAERDSRRVQGLLVLLGFTHGNLDRSRADRWMSWFKDSRVQLRAAFRKWTDLRPSRPATSQNEMRGAVDFSNLVTAASEFLEQAGWELSSEGLATAIRGAWDPQDPDWSQALLPVAESLKEAVSTVCISAPAQGAHTEVWSARELGSCLRAWGSELSVAPGWVEWVFNPLNFNQSPEQAARTMRQLEEELPVLEERVTRWFDHPGKAGLSTDKWIRMVKALGAELSDDFVNELSWISKLKGYSDARRIDPTAFSRVFRIAGQAQLLIWKAYPLWVEARKKGECKDASSWLDCSWITQPWPSQAPESVRWALRVRNLRSGADVDPMTGRRFSELAFYSALSSEVIRVFDDDQDGVIRASFQGERDQVLDLVSSAIQAIDSVDRLVSNLSRKMRGERLQNEPPLVSVAGLNIQGLSRLLALSSDILVVRDEPKDREYFEELLAVLFRIYPQSSLFLDQKALTAILVSATGLDHYSKAYVRILDEDSDSVDFRRDRKVERSKVREHLPQMIQKAFPRIYQDCMRWGWEESCDAAFMRVLPESFDPVDPEESVSFVQIRDLDLITLLGSGVEGLLDSCDRDGSGKLEGSLWSGHDELDCTVTRAKDGVTRLMESGILKMGDWGERNRTEILLQAANTLFLGRHFGKLALIKGHPVSMPFFGIWKPATLGSMLSLLGKL